MRRFKIEFKIFGEVVDTAILELADEVIDVVDDEWRAQFYNLNTPEDIAVHIGYNLMVNNWRLSSLDGWADQPDSNAEVIEYPNLREHWELNAIEKKK